MGIPASQTHFSQRAAAGCQVREEVRAGRPFFGLGGGHCRGYPLRERTWHSELRSGRGAAGSQRPPTPYRRPLPTRWLLVSSCVLADCLQRSRITPACVVQYFSRLRRLSALLCAARPSLGFQFGMAQAFSGQTGHGTSATQIASRNPGRRPPSKTEVGQVNLESLRKLRPNNQTGSQLNAR